MRGLDNAAYFRHEPDGRLVNDAGTGNTLACDHPATRRLILDALRHFVGRAGVDGFRFDLAPILARTGAGGFDPNASLLNEMAADPLLADRIMIAEPWDIGPGGYQLGHFPADLARMERPLPRPRPPLLARRPAHARRVRHRARRLLRRLPAARAPAPSTSSPPTTASPSPTSSPTATSTTHANGEHNRDGHGENHSWNNGVEGPTDDPAVLAERRRDLKALLATLFASRGTIMLTAGDEFGRTQGGNNNAYAQDNPITWLDWEDRDRDLEAHAAALAALRRAHPALADPTLLTGAPGPDGIPDVAWLTPGGTAKTVADWENAHAPGPRPCCSAAAATAASRSWSTAAATRSPSTCPPAPATTGRTPPAAASPSARAPSPSPPSAPGGPPPTRRRNRASPP